MLFTFIRELARSQLVRIELLKLRNGGALPSGTKYAALNHAIWEEVDRDARQARDRFLRREVVTARRQLLKEQTRAFPASYLPIS